MAKSFRRDNVTIVHELRNCFSEGRELSHSGGAANHMPIRYNYFTTGRSAAWLARLPWAQEVDGSNPFAPISNESLTEPASAGFSICDVDCDVTFVLRMGTSVGTLIGSYQRGFLLEALNLDTF